MAESKSNIQDIAHMLADGHNISQPSPNRDHDDGEIEKVPMLLDASKTLDKIKFIESRASVRFQSVVHEVINLNKTQTIINELVKQYQLKTQEILSKRMQKNYILEKAEEEEDHDNHLKKKSSHFQEEMDSDWEEFLHRRSKGLPELPHVEVHGGHGHGHGHGHGGGEGGKH